MVGKRGEWESEIPSPPIVGRWGKGTFYLTFKFIEYADNFQKTGLPLFLLLRGRR